MFTNILYHFTQDLYDFIDSVIMAQATPDEAYKKLDSLATRHVDILRKITKSIQDGRDARDNEAIKTALIQYDESLESYIPVLMQLANLFWDTQNYTQVCIPIAHL